MAVIAQPRRKILDLVWAWPLFALVVAALAAPPIRAEVPSASDPPPAERSGLREYVPGLKIDWTKRHIEIDSEIVLRKGPLELLACSPQTREHESILVVRPRPLHVFQALGLIGLTPGAPVRYDKAKEQWLQPDGEQVDIRIRYRDDRGEQEVAAAAWLRTTKDKKVPSDMTWVFAGSRKLEDGRFLADLDGTVICVVDFDSALVAVGSLHTADNELLWLEANTDDIPAVGTPCTIVIGPAKGAAGPKAPANTKAVEERAKTGDNPAPNGSDQD